MSPSLAIPNNPGAASSSASNAVLLPDLPPISALFFIDFDVKAGYTIVWKRSIPTASGAELELEGRVEYKSLPSGLHTVSEDLIYFVSDEEHAGLSAFVNTPCEEETARNARMIAVGILVPLSYGRLGRAWRHAESLRDMASKLAQDRKDTSILEKYWNANNGSSKGSQLGRRSSLEPPLSSASISFPDLSTNPSPPRRGHNRSRSASDGAALLQTEHRLSPYHPAWSLTSLLDKFGPLIFPIHRAALLRQRILISCHAPVHEICDFVYDISVLSNIPLSLNDFLPDSSPTQRLRPLFNIGVHDIPFLMEDSEARKRQGHPEQAAEDEAGSGWIACTTDSILAMKDTLWDVLITMPPDYSSNAKEKAWPTVEGPKGIPIKATQRDLRRFNALRSGLARMAATVYDDESSPGAEAPPAVRLSSSYSNRSGIRDLPNQGLDKLAEPLTWTALAYNGFMWWASAGEQLRSEEQDESQRDAALLADLGPSSSSHTSMSMPNPSSRSDPLAESLTSLTARRNKDDSAARIELAIIAYFHRLTTQMLSILAELVDGADEAAYRDDIEDEDEDEDEEGENGEVEVQPADAQDEQGTARDPTGRGARNTINGGGEGSAAGSRLLPQEDDQDPDELVVTIDSHSIETMGLDVWSASDTAFVEDLVRAYFGRTAKIEGKGVEVCGVRVC